MSATQIPIATASSGPRSESERWSRYGRVLVAGLLLSIAVLALFNFVLDPYGAYRALPLDMLWPYREGFETRIARAEILEHERCEDVILGTSRAQIALDPEHPVWGGRGCNLAITGTNAAEILTVLRRAIGTSGVRHVVLSLDFLAFQAGPPSHPEFFRSRFDPDLRPVDYHASLLLGSAASRASWQLLRDFRKQEQSPYHRLGRTDPGVRRRGRGARDGFVWALERLLPALASPSGVAYASRTVSELLEGVREARDRGIDVTLVLLPVHALELESLARFGHWDTFERWKRDLVAARSSQNLDSAPLWDCTGAFGPAVERVPPTEAHGLEMRWHWDSAHIRKELGDRVIDELARPPSEAASRSEERLCTALDPDTVDAVLARARAAQDAYRSEARDQVTLLDVVAQRVGLTASDQNR